MSDVCWDDVCFEYELMEAKAMNVNYFLEVYLLECLKDVNPLYDWQVMAEKAILTNPLLLENKDKLMGFIKVVEVAETGEEITKQYEKYCNSLISVENVEKLFDQLNNYSLNYVGMPISRKGFDGYLKECKRIGFATSNGDYLHKVLPKISPLKLEYLPLKNYCYNEFKQFLNRLQ